MNVDCLTCDNNKEGCTKEVLQINNKPCCGVCNFYIDLSDSKIINDKIDYLFNNTIRVNGIIWYTEKQTLRDAIINLIGDNK